MHWHSHTSSKLCTLLLSVLNDYFVRLCKFEVSYIAKCWWSILTVCMAESNKKSTVWVVKWRNTHKEFSETTSLAIIWLFLATTAGKMEACTGHWSTRDSTKFRKQMHVDWCVATYIYCSSFLSQMFSASLLHVKFWIWFSTWEGWRQLHWVKSWVHRLILKVAIKSVLFSLGLAQQVFGKN